MDSQIPFDDDDDDTKSTRADTFHPESNQFVILDQQCTLVSCRDRPNKQTPNSKEARYDRLR